MKLKRITFIIMLATLLTGCASTESNYMTATDYNASTENAVSTTTTSDTVASVNFDFSGMQSVNRINENKFQFTTTCENKKLYTYKWYCNNGDQLESSFEIYDMYKLDSSTFSNYSDHFVTVWTINDSIIQGYKCCMYDSSSCYGEHISYSDNAYLLLTTYPVKFYDFNNNINMINKCYIVFIAVETPKKSSGYGVVVAPIGAACYYESNGSWEYIGTPNEEGSIYHKFYPDSNGSSNRPDTNFEWCYNENYFTFSRDESIKLGLTEMPNDSMFSVTPIN